MLGTKSTCNTVADYLEVDGYPVKAKAIVKDLGVIQVTGSLFDS